MTIARLERATTGAEARDARAAEKAETDACLGATIPKPEADATRAARASERSIVRDPRSFTLDLNRLIILAIQKGRLD
jgi:hypothetical protein